VAANLSAAAATIATLLEAGAHPNARDVRGRSPLLILISAGRFEYVAPVAKLLVMRGADALDCGRRAAHDSLLHLLCRPEVGARPSASPACRCPALAAPARPCRELQAARQGAGAGVRRLDCMCGGGGGGGGAQGAAPTRARRCPLASGRLQVGTPGNLANLHELLNQLAALTTSRGALVTVMLNHCNAAGLPPLQYAIQVRRGPLPTPAWQPPPNSVQSCHLAAVACIAPPCAPCAPVAAQRSSAPLDHRVHVGP
jgi:hypothetical protein